MDRRSIPPEPRLSDGFPRSFGGLGARDRSHVLTVALEDYFHAAPVRPWIRENTWYRFEDRLAESTRTTLDLLQRCDVQATFFVTPSIAKAAPGLVREIAAQGHEIATAGHQASTLNSVDPNRFRASAIQCREQLEQVVGRRILGYRVSGGWLSAADLWILDLLAEAGYRYDSSIRPVLFSNPAQSWHRTRREESDALQPFYEVQVSSIGICGVHVPIGGGGPFRHYPQSLTRRAVAHWDRHRSQPYVMHLRTWELDADQPRISVASPIARFRQYRNLRHMPRLLEEVLSTYRFTGVAEHLGLDLALVSVPVGSGESPKSASTPSEPVPAPIHTIGSPLSTTPTPPMWVSVVIPCYNESLSLRYLSNTLQDLAETHGSHFAFTFVFVDDRSTDDTWDLLQTLFGQRADCMVFRHDYNRGVAAAIQTGIRHAPDDVVCSIDCDCTYDPNELCRMIPLLTDGVDVVTASPYHPAGAVRNVPAWRLFLSRSLSRLYRLVFRQKLHTYTSCFRVYRKRSVEAVDIRLPGFLGISELLARIDMAGGRIVEYPTTLEVRVLGFSKMRVARTIVGHLGFFARLLRRRLFSRGRLEAAELEV